MVNWVTGKPEYLVNVRTSVINLYSECIDQLDIVPVEFEFVLSTVFTSVTAVTAVGRKELEGLLTNANSKIIFLSTPGL